MSVVRGVRKLLMTDYPEAESWFSRLLSPLNQFLDSTISALRNGITFGDNCYCEIKELTFVHDVELLISHNLQSYSGVLIVGTPEIDNDDYIVTGFKFRRSASNQIGVKIRFAGAGTTSGTIKLIILG